MILVRIKNRNTQTSESLSPIDSDYSSNVSEDIIRNSDEKVKRKLSSQSVADPSELSDVQLGIIGDITLKAKNTDKLPTDYMVSMWGGSIMTCAMKTVSLYLII